MLEYIRSNSQSLGVKLAFGLIILVFVFWGVGSMKDRGAGNVVAMSAPLIFGQGTGENFVASDIPAFLPYTRQVVFLEDGELVRATASEYAIMRLKDLSPVHHEPQTIQWDMQAAQKGGYRHFMLKEIFEQPRVVTDGLTGRVEGDHGDVRLAELDSLPVPRRLHIVACGTSYHSGMWGRHLLEHWAHVPVQVEIASEFRYRDSLLLDKEDMTFRDSLRIGAEIFHMLQAILKKDGHVTSVGDEGGFAPNLKNHDEAFGYIIKAIEEAGYNPGAEVALAIDAAASEFYKDGKYVLSGEGKSFNNAEMSDWLAEFTQKYPLISIEDGMAESDWDGWGMLTAALGDHVQLVGDDVFVTNPGILAEGIDQGVANSILIKLNQIGTVTETLDTIEMAKEASYSTVVSHRSGETEDSFIADLAVGVNAGQIKTGSLCRSERM